LTKSFSSDHLSRLPWKKLTVNGPDYTSCAPWVRRHYDYVLVACGSWAGAYAVAQSAMYPADVDTAILATDTTLVREIRNNCRSLKQLLASSSPNGAAPAPGSNPPSSHPTSSTSATTTSNPFVPSTAPSPPPPRSQIPAGTPSVSIPTGPPPPTRPMRIDYAHPGVREEVLSSAVEQFYYIAHFCFERKYGTGDWPLARDVYQRLREYLRLSDTDMRAGALVECLVRAGWLRHISLPEKPSHTRVAPYDPFTFTLVN